jgi:hypothetical protein
MSSMGRCVLWLRGSYEQPVVTFPLKIPVTPTGPSYVFVSGRSGEKDSGGGVLDGSATTDSTVSGVSAGTPGTMTIAVFGCSIITSENSFIEPGGGKFWPNREKCSAKKIPTNKLDVVRPALLTGFMNLSLGVDARFRPGSLLVFFKTATRVGLERQELPNQRLKRGNILFMFLIRAEGNRRAAVCLSGRIPEFLSWPVSDLPLQKGFKYP